MAAVAVSAIALSGCGPELIEANETGGSVSPADQFANRDAVLTLAENHCAKFGKIIEVTTRDPFAKTMKFNCIETPVQAKAGAGKAIDLVEAH